MPNIQRKEYKGHISPEKSAERVEGNQMINNDEEAWVADYNMMGEDIDNIFPQTVSGQSMRWSKFKDKDPREIFDIISQRVFPAVKKIKNGKDAGEYPL